EPAELADNPSRLQRNDAVEGGRQEQQFKPIRTERPRDVDVVRITRPSRQDDRDVVEFVRPPGLLATSDFYFHYGIVFPAADGSRGVVGSVSERAIKFVAATEMIGPSMLAVGVRAPG